MDRPLNEYLARATASPEEVFFGEERSLGAAAKRHLRAAEVLLAHGGLELVPDADYLALLAAECFFKHMFCVVRLIRGWPVGETKEDEPFGRSVRSRSFSHNIWGLCPIVRTGHPELLANEALAAVVNEMERGSTWVEVRYKAPAGNEAWKAKVQTRVDQLRELFADLLG